MTHIHKKLLTGLMLITLSLAPTAAFAAEEVVDILPPVTQANDSSEEELTTTHPDLRLTPDKSELIRLSSDAGSIIIGNPIHINVIADSSTTLIVVPRTIGATHFTVLDKNGQIIMQRHVIVASPKENYIRIRRACADDAPNCQNTSVLYCPNMCHEIKQAEGTQEASPQSETSQDSGNNALSGKNIAGTE